VLTRRDLLAALGGAAALAGCTPSMREARNLTASGPVKRASANATPLIRKLNRLGFGATPDLLARVETMGWDAYVDEQLAANQPDPAELNFLISRLDIEHFSAPDLRNVPDHHVQAQLRQAKLLRAIYSPNQLRERMVEFWTDHFNIDAKKSYASYALADDQRGVVRPHALGSFPAMLTASAHSPAMLAYLDNKVNHAGVVNENYGREILELHTLGVHGGYTQKDVLEVSRCFTGWTVEERFMGGMSLREMRPPNKMGAFLFREDLHMKGARTVLGKKIPDGGKEQGDLVIAMLAEHSSTANTLATKLCRYFLGNLAEPFIAPTAKRYLDSKGDIKAMIEPILRSEEFGQDAELPKRPFDFIVSSLRALDATTTGRGSVQPALERLGHASFNWAMPDGYPTKTSAWTASMLARFNWALALAYGPLEDVEISPERLGERLSLSPEDAVAYCVLGPGRELPTPAKSAREAVALAIASPEFQWR